MDLRSYLSSLPSAERPKFAERCGTTLGHLRNVSYGYRSCAAELAIEIERESDRAVRCEELRPDADWAFVRQCCKKGKRGC